MRYTLLCVAFALTACASPVLHVTPLPASAGVRGFTLYTVYGTLDGTRETASQTLDRDARRLCGGNFEKVRDIETARRTAWGATNGQIDFYREVHCR